VFSLLYNTGQIEALRCELSAEQPTRDESSSMPVSHIIAVQSAPAQESLPSQGVALAGHVSGVLMILFLTFGWNVFYLMVTRYL